MIKVIASSTIKEGHLEEALELYRELAEKTRLESGCIAYEVFQQLENENKLTLIEEWDGPDALKSHQQTTHFTTIVPKLAEVQVQEPVLLYKKIM